MAFTAELACTTPGGAAQEQNRRIWGRCQSREGQQVDTPFGDLWGQNQGWKGKEGEGRRQQLVFGGRRLPP